MQGLLITAALTAIVSHEAPAEIVYIPDGSNTITPMVNGKAKTVTVVIPAGRGEAVASALQADLEKRSSENVRPHLAFDHKSGPAAGIPKSFRYAAGQGILLTLDWSKSGKAAVEGRDYSYFSPSFLIDSEGVPSGLPEIGEIGSLVNEPAFRTIPKIAAANKPTDEPQQTFPNMKLVLAALNINPADANAEEAAATRVREMLQVAANHTAAMDALKAEHKIALDAAIAERDALQAKVTAAETADTERRKSDGENLAARFVTAGLLTPKDEAGKAEIVEACESGNKIAIRLLTERVEAAEKDPKRNDPTKRVVAAAAAKSEEQPANKDEELTPYERVLAALADDKASDA